MSIEDLNEQLRKRDNLEAQVKKLQAELAEKRGQMEAVQLSGKDSNEISIEILELENFIKEISESVESTLKIVEELTQKQAEVDKNARIADLRSREQKAYDDVINTLSELGNKVDNLSEVHRILKMYGCTPQLGLSAGMIRAIFTELDYLKIVQPKLNGQEVNSDQIEFARREMMHEIERLNELITIRNIADQKQMYPELLVDYERALEIAQARLEQLLSTDLENK
jgi:hypothetical protein